MIQIVILGVIVPAVTLEKINLRGGKNDLQESFSWCLSVCLCIRGREGGREGVYFTSWASCELTHRTQPPSLSSFLPFFLTSSAVHFLLKRTDGIRHVEVLPVDERQDECDNTSLLWTVLLQIIKNTTQDRHALTFCMRSESCASVMIHYQHRWINCRAARGITW